MVTAQIERVIVIGSLKPNLSITRPNRGLKNINTPEFIHMIKATVS